MKDHLWSSLHLFFVIYGVYIQKGDHFCSRKRDPYACIMRIKWQIFSSCSDYLLCIWNFNLCDSKYRIGLLLFSVRWDEKLWKSMKIWENNSFYHKMGCFLTFYDMSTRQECTVWWQLAKLEELLEAHFFYDVIRSIFFSMHTLTLNGL